ncbi:MAG: ABC transporter substrate-binding protein [Methyloprofundus sp.]|nr:ABC transporter substrate-binding protein [Methyloprofundus sp.]
MSKLKSIVAGFILLVLSQNVLADADLDQATQVVSDFQAELIDLMKQGEQLSFEQRSAQLRPVLIKTHNMVRMSRAVMGREWKNLSQEQKKQLITRLIDLSVASYAHHFSSFSGQSFTVKSAEKVRSQIYVKTFLVLPDDEDVSIDYLLKKKGDSWRIINILSKGVSDIALKRSEYVAILNKSGFDVLLAEIAVKIKNFSKD